MKNFRNLLLAILLGFPLFAFADYDSEIKNLKLEKEKLDGEIKKLDKLIIETDSLVKVDDSRFQMLKNRYEEDSKRRKAEIDSLNSKIKAIALEIQEERAKQVKAKSQSENVSLKRAAIRKTLLSLSKKFEKQVEKTLPWEREVRLERIRSLTRDIETGAATEEEIFSRFKGIVKQEVKFGDEVAMINSPLTRKNGEVINAQILRIGNQWMVYSDDNGTVYGNLVRKSLGKNISYEWNENLDLWEREIIRYAIDIKLAKKPPQIIVMPVSLSITGDER